MTDTANNINNVYQVRNILIKTKQNNNNNYKKNKNIKIQNLTYYLI